MESTTRLRRCLGLGLLAFLLGGCPSQAWMARDAFGAKYSCAEDQVTVRKQVDATTAAGALLPDVTDLNVGGCGSDAWYRCHNATSESGGSNQVCVERILSGLEASDGSVHLAWQGDPEWPAISHQTAIQSAAQDLPCDAASSRVVAQDPITVEGCGQQVTYRLVPRDLTPPLGSAFEGKAAGYRYEMVSRAPVPAATQGAAAAPPPLPAQAPAPAPAPAAPPASAPAPAPTPAPAPSSTARP
jgi:hypothetical protein